MSKRLITASFALALGVLATPASARPFDVDNGGTRVRYSDEEPRSRRTETYRDDDGERIIRRKRHKGQANRQRRRGHAGRSHARGRTHTPPSLASRSITGQARASAGSSRSCLTGSAQALLNRIEANFGRVQVISTCRAGARIAGTGRVSKHATGQAIDFNAGNRKAEVVRWLLANHTSGGIMTYAGMSHIHVDVGYRFVALNAGRGR